MATAAQVLANQANAQHSTGPRTVEGKQASSSNATTTGLTAARIFVRPEEREIFTHFQADLSAEIQPQGVNQEHLFAIILHAAWNVRRCFTLEEEIQNEALAKGAIDAMLDDELAPKLDRIYRYKKMHESSYRRAISELRRLQTEAISRRENQELLDDSVLVDTAKVMSAVRASLKEHQQESSRDLEQQMFACLNAPVPLKRNL